MKTKGKPLAYLLIVVILALQIVPVSAQGNTPPSPDKLTAAQMKKAVVVSDGSVNNRVNVRSQIYRLQNCNEADPNVFCYFTVTGGDSLITSSDVSLITALSSSATLTCGVNVYNYLGQLSARLQENVNVTFWSQYGKTPVTLNWGDLRGTDVQGAYWSWQGLTGPNPNPTWGAKVSLTGTAYVTAGGTAVYSPPSPLIGNQAYFSARLTIRSTGWSCS
jgi:hypothetical protein